MRVEHLFCYGTLKRGYHNHSQLLKDSKFLGRALSVEKGFRLYADGIPFLITAPTSWNSNHIIGEVYEVSPETLARCDRLEGHPLMYCREQYEFLVEGQRDPVTAWCYVYQHPERFIDNTRDWVKPNKSGAVEW